MWAPIQIVLEVKVEAELKTSTEKEKGDGKLCLKYFASKNISHS